MSNLGHGVEVINVTVQQRPVRVAATSVIGVVGTAGMGPVNTPVLLNNPLTAKETFGVEGTLYDVLNDIFTVCRPLVVALNVLDPDTAAHYTAVADEAIDVTGGLTSGDTHEFAQDWPIKVTDVTHTPDGDDAVTLVEGTGYSWAVDPETGTGTLTLLTDIDAADTLTVSYRYADFDGVDEADIAGTALNQKGVYGLLTAEAVTGVRPRLIIAPDWLHVETDLSAATEVAAAIGAVADRLHGLGFLDGPNTDHADFITALGLPAGSRDVLIMVDPGGDLGATNRPASGYIAALTALMDNDSPYSWGDNPSNWDGIPGWVGTARPVDFRIDDPACEAHQISVGNNGMTVVRIENEFRPWGPWVLNGDTIQYARAKGIVADAILYAHVGQVGRGLTKARANAIVDNVNKALRAWTAQGKLLGGRCWLDPDLNTAAAWADGKLYVNYDFGENVPASLITFLSNRNTGLIETV